MNQHLDVERLSREAGITFRPMIVDGVEYQYRHVNFNDDIGGDEAACIERYTALVLEEAAKLADKKRSEYQVADEADWAARDACEEIAAALRALAEGVR